MGSDGGSGRLWASSYIRHEDAETSYNNVLLQRVGKVMGNEKEFYLLISLFWKSFGWLYSYSVFQKSSFPIKNC